MASRYLILWHIFLLFSQPHPLQLLEIWYLHLQQVKNQHQQPLDAAKLFEDEVEVFEDEEEVFKDEAISEDVAARFFEAEEVTIFLAHHLLLQDHR